MSAQARWFETRLFFSEFVHLRSRKFICDEVAICLSPDSQVNSASMILKRILAFILTLFAEFEVVSASCPRQKYEEDTGTLKSPGFGSPSSYGHNMSCTYYINLSPGKRITLEFKTLSILGCMPNCSEDSLEIFVG